MFRSPQHIRSEVKKIVHWMPEILLAAQVALRGLDRRVTEQELNLLELTAAVVAQLRTGPPPMPNAA